MVDSSNMEGLQNWRIVKKALNIIITGYIGSRDYLLWCNNKFFCPNLWHNDTWTKHLLCYVIYSMNIIVSMESTFVA